MLSSVFRQACRVRSVQPTFTRSFSNLTDLRAYPQTQHTTLESGLRIATEAGGGNTATVGVWIDAGSRFETPETNGVAHFLEHMTFKGTGKRTRTQLEVEIENIGGHLNAYTSREQTVYYMKVTKEKVPQAMEILSDILTNSQYTEEHIERERFTILRESEEIDKNFEEVIFDRLHQTAYRGTMLSKTILGSEQNIENISKSMIEDYIGAHYIAPRMVIAGAGAVDHDQITDLSKKLFGSVPMEGKRPVVMEPAKFTGSDIRIRFDDMPIAHVALGFPTGGWKDPDNFPLMVIQQLLGSWDKGTSGGGVHNSSKMIANIATDDLAHSVSTFNTLYSDTGLFGVYATCEKYGQNELMFEITRAITSLCYNLEQELLDEAKNQLKMSLLSQFDGSTAICEDIGRQMLTYGRRMHPLEALARVDAVDINAVKAAANRFFYDRDHALAAIGPIYELPDYNWIRRHSYWLRY